MTIQKKQNGQYSLLIQIDNSAVLHRQCCIKKKQ